MLTTSNTWMWTYKPPNWARLNPNKRCTPLLPTSSGLKWRCKNKLKLKSSLNLSSRCWVHFGCSSCSLFFLSLTHFVQEFFIFYVLWVFNLFFALVLFLGCFLGQTNFFGLVYGRTKNFRLTRSSRVKIMSGSEGLITCLVCPNFC